MASYSKITLILKKITIIIKNEKKKLSNFIKYLKKNRIALNYAVS